MRFIRSLSLLAVVGSVFILNTSTSFAAASSPVASPASVATQDSTFTVPQVQKIEQVIHDYLVNHPQVMVEAMQALQKQMVAEEQKHVAAISDAGLKHSKEIFDAKVPGRVSVSGENPKVIVAEFFGYQCPVCRGASPVFAKMLNDNKDLQVIFIPWTFEGEADIYAAQTSLAAQRQGKFFAVHEALLSLSGVLTKEQVDKIVKDSGLDMTRLQQDRDDRAIINGIKANFKLAQDLNLIGTPSVFITNAQHTKFKVFPGKVSPEEMQKAIDEAR